MLVSALSVTWGITVKTDGGQVGLGEVQDTRPLTTDAGSAERPGHVGALGAEAASSRLVRDPEHVLDRREVVEQPLGQRAADVDRRDRRLASAEDAVLHVLDVETARAQQVEDPGEHADPVEVPHGEGRRRPAGRDRG